MIKAIFFQDQNSNFSSFSITGHAESGPYGQDIVCAAVSGLSITIINGLKDIANDNPQVIIDEDNGGLMKVYKLSSQHDTQILLETFYNGIADMAESYPKNLTLKLKTQ